MNISKITVARLYNLGSYEHSRYEITVDVNPGDSAAKAMIALERLMVGLAPEHKAGVKTHAELDRERRALANKRAELVKLGDDDFKRRYGYFEGSSIDFLERCEKSLIEETIKRDAWDKRAAEARCLLDDLGGAAVFKDAKLDWDRDEYEF